MRLRHLFPSGSIARRGTLLFLGLALLTICSVARGQGPKPLSNDDINKMVQLKFGDGVIAAKIESSSSVFDTSVEALTKLKAAGVSDAVMQAMIAAGEPGCEAPPTALSGPSPDPNAAHDPGIYLYHQNADGSRMTPLKPRAYGTRNSWILAGLTFSIAKSHWIAIIPGPKSPLRVSESRPAFYFYFGPNREPCSWRALFGRRYSPDQFTLARFESKTSDRELVIGEWGTHIAKTGVALKSVVDFDFEKIAPGIYKIIPRADLSPGEYGFNLSYYYGNNNTGVGLYFFDFGIDPVN
jgi:hypothetical protein